MEKTLSQKKGIKTIAVDEDVHRELFRVKALLEAEEGRSLSWSAFFTKLIKIVEECAERLK
jgi:predicted CopG family antitoxin